MWILPGSTALRSTIFVFCMCILPGSTALRSTIFVFCMCILPGSTALRSTIFVFCMCILPGSTASRSTRLHIRCKCKQQNAINAKTHHHHPDQKVCNQNRITSKKCSPSSPWFPQTLSLSRSLALYAWCWTVHILFVLQFLLATYVPLSLVVDIVHLLSTTPLPQHPPSLSFSLFPSACTLTPNMPYHIITRSWHLSLCWLKVQVAVHALVLRCVV